jgi:hypothetical protein
MGFGHEQFADFACPAVNTLAEQIAGSVLVHRALGPAMLCTLEPVSVALLRIGWPATVGSWPAITTSASRPPDEVA